MTLSGIELFDANGNPISNFSLTSGSGASYGANGLLKESAVRHLSRLRCGCSPQGFF